LLPDRGCDQRATGQKRGDEREMRLTWRLHC
jgi:hypothetical protein